jgi:hypothetical protein
VLHEAEEVLRHHLPPQHLLAVGDAAVLLPNQPEPSLVLHHSRQERNQPLRLNKRNRERSLHHRLRHKQQPLPDHLHSQSGLNLLHNQSGVHRRRHLKPQPQAVGAEEQLLMRQGHRHLGLGPLQLK